MGALLGSRVGAGAINARGGRGEQERLEERQTAFPSSLSAPSFPPGINLGNHFQGGVLSRSSALPAGFASPHNL